jgi:translation initiation factor IF-1
MIDNQIIAGGTVVDYLPGACFKVALDTGVHISASVSVKFWETTNEISLGKRVTVHMSPFDLENGHITACYEK